ncbi:DUF2062 domain-containing protein [Jeongeupia chitinilytica]|uniref:DUF2062 domain-containing protein n=1 Tax=Jeongeupia chitinilytica TaxID=1041641 RepID=A0ABQ3GZM9_9NEIS|nr:DUF2062 domain-containing protein [Jeongeupia chitinilytica]GHD63085.1 hypothetical protein GCM10007350_19800 [Jeongeupia chitinilytica]
MPRRFLRRLLPDHATLTKNAFLRRYAHWFSHPNLWHLNRHSVAGGVAAGMIGGLIPGPLQVITASLLALGFRVNLPVAVFATFYTNPLTIGPLYWVAVQLGSFITGLGGGAHVPPMPGWSGLTLLEWTQAMWHWMLSLGMPLLIGLPTLAALLAVTGFFAVHGIWRVYIWLALRKRARRRHSRPAQ